MLMSMCFYNLMQHYIVYLIFEKQEVQWSQGASGSSSQFTCFSKYVIIP